MTNKGCRSRQAGNSGFSNGLSAHRSGADLTVIYRDFLRLRFSLFLDTWVWIRPWPPGRPASGHRYELLFAFRHETICGFEVRTLSFIGQKTQSPCARSTNSSFRASNSAIKSLDSGSSVLPDSSVSSYFATSAVNAASNSSAAAIACRMISACSESESISA